VKRVIARITIAACTFIIGIVAATVWLNKPVPQLSRTQQASAESMLPSPAEAPDLSAPTSPAPQDSLDSAVYSVKLCDLARDSKHYDGKIVRIRAFYNQGVDTSSLDDSACDSWLRPSCASSDKSCEKIWDRITKVLLSDHSFRVRVDVVGRYIADVEDIDPNQGGSHVHLFEILELKGAQPAKVRD
jgi:hypothetical protein